MNHNTTLAARDARAARSTNIGKCKAIGIALALGALAVPANGMVIFDSSAPEAVTPAQSAVTPADRMPANAAQAWSGRTSYQPVPAPSSNATSAVGLNRALREGPDTPDVAVPVGDDHARTDGANPAPTVALSTPRVTDGGFDWTDAGIGFGAAAGLALLGGGSFAMTRRTRRIAGA